MDNINFVNKGDFSKTFKFLNKLTKGNYMRAMLEKYGQRGVAALATATPVDSGLTASSWGYEIKEGDGTISLTWTNSHVEKGVNIAIILQYGHATRNGGYVSGRDYINPALQPIFDRMAIEAWEEVTK